MHYKLRYDDEGVDYAEVRISVKLCGDGHFATRPDYIFHPAGVDDLYLRVYTLDHVHTGLAVVRGVSEQECLNIADSLVTAPVDWSKVDMTTGGDLWAFAHASISVAASKGTTLTWDEWCSTQCQELNGEKCETSTPEEAGRAAMSDHRFRSEE